MVRLAIHLRPRPLRRFAVDRRGVSAVEFALLLPLMVMLYLGGVELGQGLTIDRKVTHVTSSLADLVTQAKVVTDAGMANILDAAAAVVTPYDDSLLRIKVSGVSIDAEGVATVAWSDALNDTPLAVNSTITLPAQVSQPNTFIVTAEVHYNYTPTIGYVLTGSFDFKDQFYLRPRLTDVITRVAG
ncbi:MAG: TadE/TadG family type IV pilus assembly protein [Bauldia sp.]